MPDLGLGDSDKQVTVEFAGQKHTAKVGDDGRWEVHLDSMKANAKAKHLPFAGVPRLS